MDGYPQVSAGYPIIFPDLALSMLFLSVLCSMKPHSPFIWRGEPIKPFKTWQLCLFFRHGTMPPPRPSTETANKSSSNSKPGAIKINVVNHIEEIFFLIRHACHDFYYDGSYGVIVLSLIHKKAPSRAQPSVKVGMSNHFTHSCHCRCTALRQTPPIQVRITFQSLNRISWKQLHGSFIWMIAFFKNFRENTILLLFMSSQNPNFHNILGFQMLACQTYPKMASQNNYSKSHAITTNGRLLIDHYYKYTSTPLPYPLSVLGPNPFKAQSKSCRWNSTPAVFRGSAGKMLLSPCCIWKLALRPIILTNKFSSDRFKLEI